MEEEKKIIGLPEIIFMVLLVGGIDLFEVISGFALAIPVIGQILIFINWFFDMFVLAITQLWFIMKGGIGFKQIATSLIGNLIEFVPALDVLPIRTVTLIIVIYMINHPKAAKIASFASGKLSAINEDAAILKGAVEASAAQKK
jgi:hypothetical protein